MKKLHCLLLFLITGGLAAVNAQTYVTVNINQPPQLAANAGVDDIICPGDSISLGGSPAYTGGTSPVTYNWSPAGSVSDPNAGTPVAGPAVSTTYSLTVTDARNCTSMDSVTIVVDTCVGLAPASGVSDFSVYPNPNDGNFNVSVGFKRQFQSATLRIHDISGKMIWEKSFDKPESTIREAINLSRFGSGVYFLKIEAASETVSRKIIIQ